MSAIAIVGMGCRFAGARNLHAYWDMTLQGRDGFGPVPPDRWPEAAFFDENRRATDKTYAPAGAFIDDVRSFPALAPRDPAAPRRGHGPAAAGLDRGRPRGDRRRRLPPVRMPRRTGVFVGVTATEYQVLLTSRMPRAR